MAQHITMTVSGTGVDMWNAAPPQPAAVIPLLNRNLCWWQPVGNYPADVFPMGTSVQDGVDELVRLFNEVFPNNSKILMGYSQGAIVVSHFIRDEVLNPRGRCYGQAKNIVAVATWGNPCRLPGFASGNQFSGWPLPDKLDGVTTGGIAGPDCLTADDVKPHLNTPVTHFWGEWVNTVGQGRDLYADAPVGDNPWTAEAPAGVVETNIYNIIQGTPLGVIGGIWRIIGEAIRTISPINNDLIATIEAIYNGGLFASAGPNAAHYTYDVQQIANFVNLAASQTKPW